MATLWTVHLTRRAERELSQLAKSDSDVWEDAATIIAEMIEGPHPDGSIALEHHPGYFRARLAGNYRMVYQLSGKQKRIVVTRIRHRSTVYQGL